MSSDWKNPPFPDSQRRARDDVRKPEPVRTAIWKTLQLLQQGYAQNEKSVNTQE